MGLFWDLAYLAVTLVPLRKAASTISNPVDKPLIILFLARKFEDCSIVSGGYSLINNPPFINIFFAKSMFSSGKILLKPGWWLTNVLLMN